MCGGKTGSVPGTNYADLPSLVSASGVEEPIPSLKEVLDELGDTCLIVEVKQNSDDLISKTNDLLVEYKRVEAGNTVWFSLKKKINKKLQRFNKHLPTICSIMEVVETLILYITGLLPFVSLGFNIFGFPCDDIHAERLHGIIPFPMQMCRFIAFAVGGKPARMFRFSALNMHLKRRGMPIFALGINDESDINSFLVTHATAALTDKPKWMLSRKASFRKENSVTSNLL